MKTKLLRKVRKQFKIYYREEEYYNSIYKPHDKGNFKLTQTILGIEFIVGFFKTKEECIESIVFWLRCSCSKLGKGGREYKKHKEEQKIKLIQKQIKF